MAIEQANTNAIKQEIAKIIVGKEEIIDAVLMAILANGHVLLEDIPGVGKTTLALAFSKCMSLSYKRMQFTPDVLPADVIGFNLYNRVTQAFEYKEGAVFCNLFLADEINRTSPKTQSALLEVMEEGKVTVDSVTRELPQPFFVIATQNPTGSAGTQKLPESQLDRFMIRLSMGYPDKESEISILKAETKQDINQVQAIVSLQDIIMMQQQVRECHVEDSIYLYIADLMELSRNNEWLLHGISPRGAKALLKMTRACAYVKGRDYVIPKDVDDVFLMVAGHRIVKSAKARAEGKNDEEIMNWLLDHVKTPV